MPPRKKQSEPRAPRQAREPKMSPIEELLEMVERRAPALRVAGLGSLRVDGFEIFLRDPDPRAVEIGAAEARVQEEDDADPLNDPATYPGGRVAGFQRPDSTDDDEK